ncbi:MAG: carbohydrate ABC transporter permease [Dehalococcoidales bacterium]|nr:carbohydrate ABC transporter permease [Dehalococcoidales bacterium]
MASDTLTRSTVSARRRRTRLLGKVAIWSALIIAAILSLLPYVWMVSSSFKSNAEVFSATIQFIPTEWRWENYVLAWTREPLAAGLLNSLIMATGEMLGNLVFCVLAAYSFARLRFKGRDIVFLFVLGTMMIPQQVVMLPNFILMRWLGWIDTYQGLIVPRMATAFGVFLMRQFFLSIPMELEEAARIDGCNRLRCLVNVLLPLTGPALATLAIFSFTQSWNEFFWPLIVVRSPEMRTIQLVITALKGQELIEWGVLMAVVTVSAIPTAILYVSLQRYFVQGLVMSGLKG